MTPQNLEIEYVQTEKLIPYARNSRNHSDEQVTAIAKSIESFGFNNPVLIDASDTIIAGHGRVLAAKSIGLDSVPCLRLSHLSDVQRRAFVIADNRMSELGGWDSAILASEIESLLMDSESGIELDDIGFSMDDFAGLGLSIGEPALQVDEDDEPTADDYADIGHGATSDNGGGKIQYPVILQLDKPTWQAWKAYKGKRSDSDAIADLIALVSEGEP